MSLHTKIFYLDTSIWLDYYLQRGYNGDVALALILKIIVEDSIIIFSNYVEKELKSLGFSPTEINTFLTIIKPKHLKHVQVTKNQLEEAYRVSKQKNVPFGDAIHALIARDCEAQLVSRDWDFTKLKEITIAKIPEDLL